MTLRCVTNFCFCCGRMLGLFLPATLGVSWKALYNSWSLASEQMPGFLSWKGVGTQWGFVLVSDFLMLLGSWILVLV